MFCAAVRSVPSQVTVVAQATPTWPWVPVSFSTPFAQVQTVFSEATAVNVP